MTKKDNVEIIQEITELREKFKQRWGQSVYSLPIPCPLSIKLSLEQTRDILAKTVNTGESIMTGYAKYILNRAITVDDLIIKVNNHTRTINKNRY